MATKNRTKNQGRGKLFLVPKTPVSEGAVFEEGDSPSFSAEKPSVPAPEQALKPTALTGRRASSSPAPQEAPQKEKSAFPSSVPRRDLSNNLLRLERKAAFFHFALQEIHDLAG